MSVPDELYAYCCSDRAPDESVGGPQTAALIAVALQLERIADVLETIQDGQLNVEVKAT